MHEKVLHPKFYRIDPEAKVDHGFITPSTVESLLDAGAIQERMVNGNWWTIRRNGQTKRWKRDTSRLRIPYKAGLYVYGDITEHDFVEFNPEKFGEDAVRSRPAHCWKDGRDLSKEERCATCDCMN
jgi:hypothetical protein